MLKPYVCVACEKVLLDHPLGSPPDFGGIPSLISLFNKIIFSVPPSMKELPANAVGPKEWTVFSMWETEPGDEEKNYFLCTQILYPDGSPFGEVNKTKIKIALNRRSQMLVNIHGFPIGQTGSYKVQTWIEESEKIVVSPIEFKIELEHDTSA